jgi:cell shape-determining protein MreC
MNKFFKWFFSPSVKDESSSFYLAEQIIELKSRVEELEKENRELKELVTEVELNLKEQIDKIHPVIYNITDSNKGT